MLLFFIHGKITLNKNTIIHEKHWKERKVMGATVTVAFYVLSAIIIIGAIVRIIKSKKDRDDNKKE